MLRAEKLTPTPAERAEGFVVEMGGKGGARRAALLAPDLRAVGVVDADRLVRQKIHFLLEGCSHCE